MPGILPTRLTAMRSLLLPVRTFTALLMEMLSKLTPFTSTSLSPTVSPACAAVTGGRQQKKKKKKKTTKKNMPWVCKAHLSYSLNCRPPLCWQICQGHVRSRLGRWSPGGHQGSCWLWVCGCHHCRLLLQTAKTAIKKNNNAFVVKLAFSLL